MFLKRQKCTDLFFFFSALTQESSIAVALPQKPEKQEGTYERAPAERKVEVVKVCKSGVRLRAFWATKREVSFAAPPLQVFLQAHPQTGENIKMITDEVSQIQEVSLPPPQGGFSPGGARARGRFRRVRLLFQCKMSSRSQVRYCLKTLREQMAARQNHNNKVNNAAILTGLSQRSASLV